MASVALVTVLLFTAYAIFFSGDKIDTVENDPLYSLTEDAKNALGEIGKKTTITVSGYNPDDEHWTVLYRYAEVITQASRKLKLKDEDLGFSGVRVSSKSGEKDIAFDKFFEIRYDGARYAFDGENLIVNAILSLDGQKELKIGLRALSGFDTDGDNVTGKGLPFIFPSVERANIDYIQIKNSHGEYSLIQNEGEFYFSDSSAVDYDAEMFSLLTTNCRYTVSSGKMEMPENRKWEDYGITDDGGSTASYSIMTSHDKDGNYSVHTVYIGNLSSTGSYYYARYIGARLSENKEDSINLSKKMIYFFPASAVDGSITLPQTDIMKPSIINPVDYNEALYAIDNVRIDDLTNGISLTTRNIYDFNAADNLSAIDETSLTTVISDKKIVSSYGASDNWTKAIDKFAGFSSSDGETTYIEAALARAAVNGKYSVNFGLLRDEANGAYIPGKIRFTKSYDGINWHDCGEIITDNADGQLRRYEFSFEDSESVKFLRIHFDVPLLVNSYVVFDEFRIYADDNDAQPYSAIRGRWKLTAPSSMIPAGRNYAYLDMSNFGDFIQEIAALEGEKVVGFGFSNNGDASTVKKEVLEPFGLDNPDKRFVFEYDGVITELFVSKPNENGKYYAYSTFSGEVDGKPVCASTDVIVELSLSSAKWLAWDMTEYLDHSLFSIYLDDVSEITISADGKSHRFEVKVDKSDNISDIIYNGESRDVLSFKYLYESLVGIYMHDKYVPVEGEEYNEYFSIKVTSETDSPEIVFYRVSSTKCFYTIDGEGGYYVYVEDVNKAIEKLNTYVSGGTLSADR